MGLVRTASDYKVQLSRLDDATYSFISKYKIFAKCSVILLCTVLLKRLDENASCY
jgi:hypothetical protein